MAKISKKDRKKMSTVREVAGTAVAAKQLYDMAKPIIKKGVKKAKDIYQKRKDKRKYDNNNYKEGK